jgi:hypothetical protein
LRRAKTLARLLADTEHGAPMLPSAGAELTKRLNARLDGLASEHAETVEANVKDLLETSIVGSKLTIAGEDVGVRQGRLVATHARDVVRDSDRLIGSIKEGVGKAWFAHRLSAAQADSRDLVRVRCAALLRIESVRTAIDEAATGWVQEQLAAFRVAIKNTTGSTRDAFTRVMEQTAAPEAVTIQLRDNERAATKHKQGDDLPRYSGHLFADADGLFPVDLNDWERTVVEAEIARPGFVAWYRNPGSATPASLRIAYQNDADEWQSVQPDFIIISRRDDGTLAASIVDPHGDHLADARGKLRALASFAETHGNRFVRVESIAKTAGGLRALDLTEASVRAAVASFEGAKVSGIYEADEARPYP